MTGRVKLAVLGAGLIGKRHIEHIDAAAEAELIAIVDPAPAGKLLAAEKATAWYPSFAAMLGEVRPDGVIIATPNQLHVAGGLEAVAAGVAALVEKPLADDAAAGRALVEAAEKAGVPLLVGHHRRHNPMIQKARALIRDGAIGDVVAVHASSWFLKPDDYFDVAWRREKGAGPVFLNLIHDVDLLRYLCGEIVSVQARESAARRGNPVEETAVVLLQFAGGALATMTVSDTIGAPWSWETTTGENPHYPKTEESCYWIGGSRGALTIPGLELWTYPGAAGWREPMAHTRIAYTAEDPLTLQIRNFCEVIRGRAAPLVSGREGLKTLEVIEAIKLAAQTGRLVELP